MAKKKAVDFWLLFTVMVIIFIGLVMVYSSSWPEAISEHDGDGAYFFKKQIVAFVLGIGVLVAAMNLDYRVYKKYALAVFLVALVLNIAILSPLGLEINGATRWLEIPHVITFMPSDIMKISSVVFLSSVLAERGEKVTKFFKGYAPVFSILVVPCAVILSLQSDLGTSGTLGISLFLLLFVAGCKMRHLAATGLMGLVGGVVFMLIEPYRAKRFKTFLDPFQDKLGDGWQVVQSLYAIGSGGLLGTGLGQSKQKYYYVPFPYSDFIFSIFAEEFGFIGVALLLGLYVILAWRGIKIALKVNESFGSYLAIGIVSLIIVQSLVHIAVVSSSMPATGITMPLMSYGGTSLMINMACIGILLNISRHIGVEEAETKVAEVTSIETKR